MVYPKITCHQKYANITLGVLIYHLMSYLFLDQIDHHISGMDLNGDESRQSLATLWRQIAAHQSPQIVQLAQLHLVVLFDLLLFERLTDGLCPIELAAADHNLAGPHQDPFGASPRLVVLERLLDDLTHGLYHNGKNFNADLIFIFLARKMFLFWFENFLTGVRNGKIFYTNPLKKKRLNQTIVKYK
jgi:hypothetical protein